MVRESVGSFFPWQRRRSPSQLRRQRVAVVSRESAQSSQQ